MQYVAPSAPLTIGGVLDNWIRLFRSSLRSCWAIALLAAAAGALVQFTVTPPAPTPNLPPGQSLLQYWTALAGPRTALTDIALALIGMLVYAALLTQQAALARGEEPFSFGTAVAKGLRRVPQMLLGWLLLVLIIAAICVPAGIGAAVFIPFRHAPLAILLAALGLVALLIVMIYVMVRLQLWLAVLFTENRSAPAALGRSWDLVKGHWWRVTGIGFVSGIVIGILTWAVSAAIGIAVGVLGLPSGTPDLLVRRIQIIGAVSQVVRLLTMPLLTAVWLAIYQDLVLRREGGDLAARAEALRGN
jgi:hypothetical protein